MRDTSMGKTNGLLAFIAGELLMIGFVLGMIYGAVS
jgi:hypothetical protein